VQKGRASQSHQNGANTFGCKIDGVLFTPSKSAGLFGSPPLTVYNIPSSGFTLLGKYYGERAGDPTSKNVILSLVHLTSTGTYSLNSQPNKGIFEHDYAGGPHYETDATHTGTVNITLCDTVNHIYSGTFSFTAVDKNTGKVVSVTDGRFDVKR
jgi:hypothetical protein